MNNLSISSLKIRFILTFIVLEFVFLSMIAFANYMAIKESTEELSNAKIQILQKLGSELLATPITIYDVATLDTILRDMNSIKDIIGANVKNYKGETLSSIGYQKENYKVYKLETEIFVDDLSVGSFQLFIDKTATDEILSGSTNISIFIILLEIIFASIISWFIGTKIIDSYKHLQEERDVFVKGPSLIFKWQKGLFGNKCAYVSKNIKDILNISHTKFLDESIRFSELIHEDDFDRVFIEIENSFDKDVKNFAHTPFRMKTKDGKYKWFRQYTNIVKNSNGEIENYYAHLFEITDLKDKEEKLEISRNKLRAIWNAQQNIIFILHGEEIADANSRFYKFFGDEVKKVSDVESKFFPVCKDTEYLNCVNESFPWFKFISENRDQIHKVRIDKDDQKFIFSIKLNSVNLGGENTSDIYTFEDITIFENYQSDLKREIELSVEKLREKDKYLLQQSRFASMGEMIGNIAHQWRQPLNNLGFLIQDVSEAYEYDELDEKYIEHMTEKSMALIKKMSNTIDDFRDFFKPDKTIVKFKINELIEDALELSSSGLEKNFIKIRKNFGRNIESEGFPHEFSQVILNIVNNAKDILITKNQENRVIWIRTFTENNCSIVEIEDNGGGIPEDVIDKVFEPYFTTKHQSNGTGIGLYMSKTIIETNMKGKLLVWNSNLGATFRIQIRQKFL
jgi:PAS domain S-box-containing protein